MMGTSRDQLRLDLGFDVSSCVFFGSLCTLSALLIGLVPALRAARTSASDVLHAAGGERATRRTQSRVLVGVQILICAVVLFAAGLFLRTFQRLVNTNLGFRPENVMVVDIKSDPAPKGLVAQVALWSLLRDRAAAIPGVESASLSSWAMMIWQRLVRTGAAARAAAVPFRGAIPCCFSRLLSRHGDALGLRPRHDLA